MNPNQTSFEKRIINLSVYYIGTNLLFQFILIPIFLTQFSLGELLGDQVGLFSAVNYGLTFIVLIAINYKKLSADWQALNGHWKKIVINNFKYYSILLALNFALGNLLAWLAGTDTVSNQDLIENQLALQWLPMTLSTVIFAPLIEELVFRYSLMTIHDTNRNNRILWWILSSALFGFMHIIATLQSGNLNELWFFFQYFAMGLVFGYSYWQSKNIWVPIFLHTTMNFISVMLITFVI